MFKRLFMLLPAVGLLVGSVRAGALSELHRTLTTGAHYSLSGQFVVYDLPPETSFHPSPTENPALMEVDPTLMAVSCERIKKSLLSQFSLRDEWRGKIYINLYRTPNGDDPVVVAPSKFEREWSYRLDMPQRLERSRLISAVVEVLLLEMAERNSDSSTQIPPWLSEGMSREVMLCSEGELVLERPHHLENGLNLSRLMRTNLFSNPLIKTHEAMMTLPPLTLEELSWPQPGQFDGSAGEAYRACAQLFVHDLLQLNDGHQCLRNFLGELPLHLNWQIGFLRAFHSHFATQLEVEKWWALQVVQFTGRDLARRGGRMKAGRNFTNRCILRSKSERARTNCRSGCK